MINKLSNRKKVLIAGIGGASLGTEILKCLQLADKYEIYGCDISLSAYGLYEPGFAATRLVTQENYIDDVLRFCDEKKIKWIIPGGEQPNTLLNAASEIFSAHNITVVTNDRATVELFSDKDAAFKKLDILGVPIPKTQELKSVADLVDIGLPCIVKPAVGSGGSVSVFFAVTSEEALIYADYIRRNGSTPIAQEYINNDDGEFTIGVLSLPNGELVGSVALRRALDAKLSVAYKGRGGLISSGYSQGRIDIYSELCEQAEKIAVAIKSRGPINVQGRVRDGILLPFEINPRFSASTYLRALAGFNEIDIFLDYLSDGKVPKPASIKSGWYLRSLTENYIADDRIQK